MSVKKAQRVIENFIQNEEPEVLSIKGGWGVGKTFFWDSIIKNASSKSKKNPFTHYAYVSLFGITSLEELKSTLFEQIIDKSEIGHKLSIKNLKKNSDELTKSLGKTGVSFLQEIPQIKNLSTAIQTTSYINDKKLIICFDDFERKGENLNIKEIMGLVSILKEQRDCKIVLILSDSNLDKKSYEEYWQFREKVIDIEIKYSPTYEEAAKLAFKGNPHNYARLKQLSTQLKITNIRILNKIEKSVNDVLKVLENLEPEISDQVMHTLMILTLSYYTHSNEFVPPYHYIKEIGYKLYGLEETTKTKNPDEIRWDSILREYGFQTFDDFDIALSNVIETGYVDHDVLLSKAKMQNELILSNKSQVSFSHAWDMYHHSFNDNSNELLSSLGNSLIENAKHISPADMNATVRLFKRLDKDEEGSLLVDRYIEINKDNNSLFDLAKNPLSRNIDDSEVIEKFNERYYEIKNIKNAEDVLTNIVEKNGCSQSDEAILAKTSINQFYELFKKQNGMHLSNYVDSCLQFGRIDNANDQQLKISENATLALVKIGYENQLNALRVRKFGVDIYEYEKPN
ncbi:MAG: P-loop NTPase fold protein [Gammaproteobacteria bacterium]